MTGGASLINDSVFGRNNFQNRTCELLCSELPAKLLTSGGGSVRDYWVALKHNNGWLRTEILVAHKESIVQLLLFKDIPFADL